MSSKPKQPEKSLEEVMNQILEGQKKHVENAHVKMLTERVLVLEKEKKAILQIKDFTGFKIEPTYANGRGEAVAIAIASDWHVGELVDPKKINSLNKYNPAIAKIRATEFFQNTLKLIKKERQAVQIKTLVLGLLGDFISGNIHEELLSNTAMPPIEEALFAQSLIYSGIVFLLENSNLNLVIPCSSGNHSRITKKTNITNEAGNSLEYYMYHMLKSRFEGEKRVQFVIAPGYLNYLDVFGYKLRFHHGHNLQYNGGVGGVTIPINKAVNAWNASIKADQEFFGHFHTYTSSQHWTLNGSMIGYNAFALSIKASPEKPQQAFCLFDKIKGRTTQCPILFTPDNLPSLF